MSAPTFARILVATLLTLAPSAKAVVAQRAASDGIGIPSDVFTIQLTYESQIGPPPVSQGISKWTLSGGSAGRSGPIASGVSS